MPEDTYTDVLNHLGQLYPHPAQLQLKGTHRRIAHLAHGWYMRTHRGIEAVLLLREEGYAAESWPIRRSVLEHVVALKWLAAEGNVVADVVRRANAVSAERRKKALSQAGWRSASLPIFEDVIADKAATEEFKRFDELHNFAPRCARYGTPNDLASYMIETAHSHPDWDTASAYFEEPSTMLLEPKSIDRDDEGWCAMHLWEALASLNRMMEMPAWTDELEEMRTRIRLLAA